jgi:outer membrane protein
MNKDSKYLPTVAFEGSAKKIINRYGEGNDFNRPWDDKEYQALINLNIPLYEGEVKNIKIEKNSIELINLKLKYNETKNLIIENVKKNYESFSSSYEKIKFAKISENSSMKNFELIQDKYKNGKENIISLLDAQNSYIVSKLNLNISIIDYLVDLSSIYFFSGKIDILVNQEKKVQLENKITDIIQIPKGSIK